jgi:hypothetical protein
MSRRLRPLAALANIAAIALIGAGCSNGSAENSSAGTATSAGTGGSQNATDQDKAVKFAECMRANGVPDFPDPNTKGADSYGVSVSPAVFTKAVDACKALEPPGALSAKLTPEQQSAALRFAQCVRDHGVEDFPDPVSGQPLIDTTKIPSSNKPGGMTILNAATHKCGGILHLSAGGQG